MISQSPATSVDDAAPGRVTLRVRNIREAVVYHLMFDGDVGRLTGAQLKAHIQSICGIPQDQQILTFNGLNVTNATTGYDLGFHSGAMLLLDTVARGGASRQSAAKDDLDGVRGSSNDTSLMRTQQPVAAASVPRAAARGSRFEEQLEAVRREEALRPAVAPQHMHSAVSQSRGLSRSVPAASVAPVPYPAPGVYDDLDLDVEVVEETGGPLWQPTNSVDVEEARLLQQDYIWKMEQVRFETERMNREREMMRQRQELDYQSELLERERIELERKTHGERLKLSILQSTLHDEMNINARVSALSEESVHRQRY
jgi:hypothetical protein